MSKEVLEENEERETIGKEVEAEGVTKKIFSLLFFACLLGAFFWWKKNEGVSFLDEVSSVDEVEELQVDVPIVLESYLPEVTKALEIWRKEASWGDSLEVTRIRHSDDLEKMLVEYLVTQGEGETVRNIVLERDEFARFVYQDSKSGSQVVVYSPAEQRQIKAGGESD